MLYSLLWGNDLFLMLFEMFDSIIYYLLFVDFIFYFILLFCLFLNFVSWYSVYIGIR